MAETESVESPHFALLLEQISFNFIDSLNLYRISLKFEDGGCYVPLNLKWKTQIYSSDSAHVTRSPSQSSPTCNIPLIFYRIFNWNVDGNIGKWARQWRKRRLAADGAEQQAFN